MIEDRDTEWIRVKGQARRYAKKHGKDPATASGATTKLLFDHDTSLMAKQMKGMTEREKKNKAWLKKVKARPGMSKRILSELGKVDDKATQRAEIKKRKVTPTRKKAPDLKAIKKRTDKKKKKKKGSTFPIDKSKEATINYGEKVG